jgi:hypothetical protein
VLFLTIHFEVVTNDRAALLAELAALISTTTRPRYFCRPHDEFDEAELAIMRPETSKPTGPPSRADRGRRVIRPMAPFPIERSELLSLRAGSC